MAFRNVLRKDRAMLGVGATEDDDESAEWWSSKSVNVEKSDVPEASDKWEPDGCLCKGGRIESLVYDSLRVVPICPLDVNYIHCLSC